MQKGIDIHIYHSPFEYESRIFKETMTIARLKVFAKIMLFGISKQSLPSIQSMDGDREIYRIRVASRILPSKIAKMVGQIEWQLKLLLKIALLKDVRVIHAHSLSVLPLAVLLKKLKKLTLIYDTHELETETVNIRGIRKTISKWLEKKLIQSADHIIAVSDSIAQWYQATYKLPTVLVIRNIPYYQELPHPPVPLKRLLGIEEDEILFLYQGVINAGRGINETLDLFKNTEKNKHILFIGHGSYAETIKQLQNEFKNIHYLPAMPFDELIQHTMGADVGIHMIEPNCLNHQYCLPNKIFEYLHAGIALLVRDTPEMAAIVKQHECGWLLSNDKSDSLTLINQITMSEINSKRENSKKCRSLYSWKNEEQAIQLLFSRVF
jgi:glycosyltransferase involved in cell wall biosynthesis